MSINGTRIPLTTRGVVVAYAIVDDADATWVNQWTWHPMLSHDKTYAYRQQALGNNRAYAIYLHRELLGLPHRSRNPQADHIDRDPLNDRRENLRVVTPGQNMQNKRLYRNNTSGYRGVSWHTIRRAWVAQARINNYNRCLGYFSTPEEAATVALAWRQEHMTHATD